VSHWAGKPPSEGYFIHARWSRKRSTQGELLNGHHGNSRAVPYGGGTGAATILIVAERRGSIVLLDGIALAESCELLKLALTGCAFLVLPLVGDGFRSSGSIPCARNFARGNSAFKCSGIASICPNELQGVAIWQICRPNRWLYAAPWR